MDMTTLENVLHRAIYDVIENMGIDEFKKTSFFMSSHKCEIERREAA